MEDCFKFGYESSVNAAAAFISVFVTMHLKRRRDDHRSRHFGLEEGVRRPTIEEGTKEFDARKNGTSALSHKLPFCFCAATNGENNWNQTQLNNESLLFTNDREFFEDLSNLKKFLKGK